MIYSLRELLKLCQEVKYLCYPLLTKGGVMVIGAPAKSKKSFFALNFAYCLAEGRPFLGWKIEKQHKVLYIEHEIGAISLRQRMKGIHSYFDGGWVEDNLKFHCKDDGEHLSLDGEKGQARLRQLVEEIRPDVVVIDPLRRFHGQDEDSSTEMKRVFDGLDVVQGKGADKPAIVLIHHTGKRNELRSRSDPESLRGSSFVFDAGDSYLMMEPSDTKGSDKMRLHFVFRHSADLESVWVRFNGDKGVFEK